MSSMGTLTAVVFVLSIFSWLTYTTMKSMKAETELVRISSAFEAFKISTREQQELSSSAVRNAEDQMAQMRSELTQADKKLEKAMNANAKLVEQGGSLVQELNDKIAKLEEKMLAQESSAADSDTGVKTLTRKAAELFEGLATQQDASVDLAVRFNETTAVVAGLVAQVVQIKEELSIHTATPHLPVHKTEPLLLSGNASAVSHAFAASPPPPPTPRVCTPWPAATLRLGLPLRPECWEASR